MREQEFKEDSPSCEPIMVRQPVREGQALLENYKKGREITCVSVGRCLAYAIWSVTERVLQEFHTLWV